MGKVRGLTLKGIGGRQGYSTTHRKAAHSRKWEDDHYRSFIEGDASISLPGQDYGHRVAYKDGSQWDPVHDAISGTYDDSALSPMVSNITGLFSIYRSFLSFDLSSLPVGSTILSAVLHFNISKNINDPKLVVQKATLISLPAGIDDYDSFEPTLFSEVFDPSVSGWCEITLNVSAIAYLQTQFWNGDPAHFCLRDYGYDYSNISVPLDSSIYMNLRGYGSGYDPYLAIHYRRQIRVTTTTTTTVSTTSSTISTSSTLSTSSTSPQSDELPQTIEGLSFWVSADVGVTTDSGSVTLWEDRSDNGYDADSPASGNRPTLADNQVNGLPSVHFTNSPSIQCVKSHSLASLFNGDDTPFTVIYVFRPSGDGRIWAVNASNGNGYANHSEYYYGNTNDEISRRPPGGNESYAYPTSPFTKDAFQVVSLVFTGTAVSLYVDKSQKLNAESLNVASMSSSLAQFWIGCWGDGSGNPYQGIHADFCEFLVYDSALGSADREDIEDYFFSKYDL
jgi:hypothetical protein